MAQKYNNIPVKPEIYIKLKLIADANNRGLGDQVAEMVKRELPICEHDKQAVRIEHFSGQGSLSLGVPISLTGWYCPTCNRVYQYAEEQTPVVKIKKGAKVTA